MHKVYFFVLFLTCFTRVSLLNAQDYFTNGTATKLGTSDCYRLTQARNFENGSVWYSDKLNLKKNIKLEFSMNLGSIDANGADGIVFVMQTVGTSALGASGGGLGFQGFAPAFGIEFDTWQNSDQGDPAYDHCAFLRNGNTRHGSSDNLAGPVQISNTTGNVEDGRDHHVIVEWNASSKTIQLFFDCELRLTRNIDLVQNIFNGKSEVFWGFTAATGGSTNNQVVCLRKDIIVNDTFKICRGGQVQISAGQSIDQVYSWTPAQNITQTNTQKTVVSPVSSGFYTATYKNFCNQTVQDKIWIEVTPGPQFYLGNDTMLCEGQNLMLTVNVPGLKSVVWDNMNLTANRMVNKEGIYWARATDTAGCFSSDTIVIQASELPKVDLGKDTSFCEGSYLALQLSTPYSVLWEDLSSSKSRIITKAGTYFVTVSNPCGIARDTIMVSELSAPSIFLGKDTALCEGQQLWLEALDPEYIETIWQDGSQGRQFNVTLEGKYFVDVKGSNGCSGTDSIEVFYILPPKAVFPDDTVVCRNEILRLTVDGREMEVFWNGTLGEAAREVVNFDGTLQMTARNNCGEINREVNIATRNCICQVYYPNAISMNGDQLNESFGPVYDCIWDSYNLKIYNRWGELVYENQSPGEFWDGTYNGTIVQGGYYVWIVHYVALENTVPVSFQQKGVVYILR